MERFGDYNEYINNIDVKKDNIPDTISENYIKDKVRKYVENELKKGISPENYKKLLEKVKTFLESQDVENKNLEKELSGYKEKIIETTKDLLSDLKEELDDSIIYQEAKKIVYGKLGINENLAKNSKVLNFTKGIVDVLVFENIDLAIEIFKTGGKILIDALKTIFTWEGLKMIGKALGESVFNLFKGNAYEKGKSVGELGLVAVGVGLSTKLGKEAVKATIKKLKSGVPKEKLVENVDIKNVITDTKKAVDDIVPTKQVDLEENLLKDIEKNGDTTKTEVKNSITGNENINKEKIIDKENNFEKGKIDIQKQIEGLKEFGVPESLSRDLLESGLVNTDFFKGDLLARFENLKSNGIKYNEMIDNAIKDIPDLTREEALLIFLYTDKIYYKKLNAFLRKKQEILSTMTEKNIKVSDNLKIKLEKALEKMPDLEPGKDGYILRGDKSKYREGNIGDKLELKAFTSVSNNKADIFLGEKYKNDAKIFIIGKQGRVKDISKLAAAVNFGYTEGIEEIGKFKSIAKTTNEGVIFPDSVVKIISKEKTILKIDGIDTPIEQIKVEQLK